MKLSQNKKPKNNKPKKKGKLNNHMIQKLCKFIMVGNYVNVSCAACGIEEATYYNWLKRGEKEKNQKTIYAKFYKAIKEAEAKAEASLVNEIRKHTAEDWRACETILKRRFRNRWGDNVKVENTDEERIHIILPKEIKP